MKPERIVLESSFAGNVFEAPKPLRLSFREMQRTTVGVSTAANIIRSFSRKRFLINLVSESCSSLIESARRVCPFLP